MLNSNHKSSPSDFKSRSNSFCGKKSSFGKKDHLSSLGTPLNNHKLSYFKKIEAPLLLIKQTLPTLETYHCILHTLSWCHNDCHNCHNPHPHNNVTSSLHSPGWLHTEAPCNARAVSRDECHGERERGSDGIMGRAEDISSHVNPEPRQRTQGAPGSRLERKSKYSREQILWVQFTFSFHCSHSLINVPQW